MADESDNVIHQLVMGDETAIAEIVEHARTSDDVTTVVAAALFASADSELMERAVTLAVTTRDRQLVAIAAAHLQGDTDRVADLARDHLVDHPDNVLVAWITAAANTHNTINRKDPS